MNRIIGIRFGAVLVAMAFFLVACSTKSENNSHTGNSGGTLYILTEANQIEHLDPQRNYVSEDLAFASSFLNRTLTQYTLSKDKNEASELVADLAMDTGETSDSNMSWTFRLRDDVKWQDGKPVTCEDVAYGVSRTFATDVITDGFMYAISMLDIPKLKDTGNSKYPGPYVASKSEQNLFDQAVSCRGNKITFHLARPTADFNQVVTLSAFAPVRKDADTRGKYDNSVLSNGPYKIASFDETSKLVLVRNDQWSKDTDSIRPAYPDSIVYEFSIPQPILTKRLMNDSGKNAMAISPSGIDPTQLTVVFSDEKYANRRINDYKSFVSYFAINTKKIPNVKHRQAILAAINRENLRDIAGGFFAGDYADGVITPGIGQDYAPTGLWDGLLGEVIPPTGNPAFAKKLIAESGQKFPNPIVFDYIQSPTGDKAAASVVVALSRVGIKVNPHPITKVMYQIVVSNVHKQGALSIAGWTPDWASASTVIPELFSDTGGYNLSQFNNEDFNAKILAAKALSNRVNQADAWHKLNVEAAKLALTVPIRFARVQRLQGSKIKGAYIWGPYGAYSYGAISVTP